MLIKAEKYDNSEPAGVLLPKVTFEKEFLEEIGLDETASSYEVLKNLCRKGIKDRGLDKLENKQIYFDRTKRELETFEELGFTDYVLLNHHIWVRYAKKEGFIIGDGRGSAAGSLVLYLIGVTNVDPIPNNLYFERFVSKSRAKKIIGEDGQIYLDGSLLMDVDSDIGFSDRQSVVNFLEQTYKGKTAKIATVNTLSTKLIVKEAMKYCNDASEEDANHISDLIMKKFGNVDSVATSMQENAKFAEWAKQNQKVIETATKLENLNKNFGVHPSGILVSNTTIADIMPIQKTKDGDLVSAYEMKDAGDLATKMDILGLKTLSVADKTCKKIGIKFNEIDPNHPSIYQFLQNFDNPYGLFQISASATAQATRDIKPVNLNELSDVVAISRPGSCAFIGDYLKVKNGETKLPKRHPILDEILAESKGIILMQEQTMAIVHKVFGLSLEDAENIRRCLHGDTVFFDADDWEWVSIKELFKSKAYKNHKFLTVNEKGEIQYSRMLDLWSNGVKNVVELKLVSGYSIRLTEDHEVLTNNGWKQVKHLDFASDKCVGFVNSYTRMYMGERIGNSLSHYMGIESIKDVREAEVFDFTMQEDTPFIVANGIVVHNCIGKKMVEEMPKWEKVLYDQAEKIGLDKSIPAFCWPAFKASASYSFNKCAEENSIVQKRNGESVKMKDIQVGDEILAYDLNNDKDHYVKILNKYHNELAVYEVELENGKTIQTSLDHKFLCSDKKMRTLEEILNSNKKIEIVTS